MSQTFAKVHVARTIYEALLTEDTLERHSEMKTPTSYHGIAERELNKLAEMFGFRLVSVAEQKDAA